MRVLQKRQMAHHAVPSNGIDRLILAAGDDEFVPLLFDTVSEYARADMYASFRFSDPDELSLLFAGGAPGVPDRFPIEASQQYAQCFWRRDPLVKALVSDRTARCDLRTQSSERIPSGTYRSFCYDNPGVLDRLTIFRRTDTTAVLLNFHRYCDSGRFSDREVYRVSTLSEVLSALIVKHFAVMDALATAGQSVSPRALSERLRRQGVALSDREVSVCAALLSGDSMKQISCKLGVELSTTITYKRRAFDKIGISTRSELRALITDNRTVLPQLN